MKLVPAPIRTDIVEKPLRSDQLVPLVTRPWAQWFRFIESFSMTTSDHDMRPGASQRVDGSLHYETDRNAFYIALDGEWRLLTATMVAAIEDRPNDLDDEADIGFVFYPSDWSTRFVWSGTEWKEL